jgi:hypothetical protein
MDRLSLSGETIMMSVPLQQISLGVRGLSGRIGPYSIRSIHCYSPRDEPHAHKVISFDGSGRMVPPDMDWPARHYSDWDHGVSGELQTLHNLANVLT